MKKAPFGIFRMLVGVGLIFSSATFSQQAEARNWSCGSVIGLRGHMSWTDFLHKPANNINLTTYTYSHGNEWTFPTPHSQRCWERSDGVLVAMLDSWQATGLRANSPSSNGHGGYLPGGVDAGGHSHGGTLFEFIPVGNNKYHVQIWGGSKGLLHRRQTWGHPRVVTWPYDAPGSRWEITCIRGCR